MKGRRAAFMDRDGTIIRDASYIRDPRDVELLPGAAAAIRRLNEADVCAIVITNQSGIARGLLTLADYNAVRDRIDVLLHAEHARIIATYMCPHHPDVDGQCDCRKPGLLMYRQAMRVHDVDSASSLFVGDRMRDVIPAVALGGTGIMLDVDSTPMEDRAAALAQSITMERSLEDAVDRFLRTLTA